MHLNEKIVGFRRDRDLYLRVLKANPSAHADYNDAIALLERTKKRCSDCLVIKELEQYHIDRKNEDGLLCRCKECQKAAQLRNYASNPMYGIKKRKWEQANLEHVRASHRRWASQNKAVLNERAIRYRLEHPHARVTHTLRSRLYSVLKTRRSSGRLMSFIGLKSAAELLQHLESLWLPGMSWDNYGKKGWHIDHVRPLSSYDLSNIAEVAKASHYTNLQPLWWRDNLKKGATFSGPI